MGSASAVFQFRIHARYPYHAQTGNVRSISGKLIPGHFHRKIAQGLSYGLAVTVVFLRRSRSTCISWMLCATSGE
jgi:hypothetical protein